jgi:hypothetical protein
LAGVPERPQGGLVLRRGDPEQGFLEHRGGEGVEGEPAVDPAVAVLPHGQPGRRRRGAFLAFEEPGFVGVGHFWREHLEEPAAEQPQRLGVVAGGEVEQMRLGPLVELAVEVVGELGERTEDHRGLLDLDPAVGQRGPGGPVALEVVGEPDQGMRAGPGGPGGVRVPVRGRGGTRL